jgi:hypothetical protein
MVLRSNECARMSLRDVDSAANAGQPVLLRASRGDTLSDPTATYTYAQFTGMWSASNE